MEITINDVRHELDNAPATVGKLVAAVVRQSQCNNAMVTSLLIDGVEQCGDAFVATSPVAANADVIATVIDYNELLSQSLADGVTYLGSLRTLVKAVSCELGTVSSKEVMASRCKAVAEGLIWFVKLTEAFEASDAWDFATTQCEGRTLADAAVSLQEIVQSAYEAQVAEDMVRYADVLEYGLDPELGFWEKAYAQMGSL